MILSTTPSSDGFHVLADSHWHFGSLMVWPFRNDVWRMGAKPAQAAFAEVAGAVSRFEPVTVFVCAGQYENARNRLPKDIRVVELSTNEAFIRDYGPTFIGNASEVRGVSWTFNGYGGLLEGLYFPWDADNAAAQKICEVQCLDYYQLQEFVLEGCAFQTDGDGTMVVTEECLLSEGRNPSLNKEMMEATFRQYLGVRKIIWLHNGLHMDEGKGHIDNLFSFIAPGEALLSWTDDPQDPQYEIVRDARRILEQSTDACGRRIRITELPLPEPLIMSEEEAWSVDGSQTSLPHHAGDIKVASYMNFYLANGGLIFPVFGSPVDEEARNILSRAFPQRQCIGISSREIFLGGGGIHSIVLGQPGSI